jgi:hypothetical protein
MRVKRWYSNRSARWGLLRPVNSFAATLRMVFMVGSFEGADCEWGMLDVGRRG